MATTAIAIATMKVAQVPNPGADFRIVEREVPEPGVGHVRIEVQACGVCHSDVLTKEGLWPGIQYPRVPGHEVAGIIDERAAKISAPALATRAVLAAMPADTDALPFLPFGTYGRAPMIETYPLEKAGEAYPRMMSGKAQFRVVLTM
jgi:D-arabinose 1-dehydrogenase-like Zn-dependent alcohol dehydrogenase